MAKKNHIHGNVFHIEITEMDQHFTNLRMWVNKDPRWIDFDGDCFRFWNGNPVRAHTKVCWAELLHDAMEGWHTCVLHAGDRVTILPFHPDHAAVQELFERATA